jgi:beta-glucanase (GH16 family)
MLPMTLTNGKLLRPQFVTRIVLAGLAIAYLMVVIFSLQQKSLTLPFGIHRPASSQAAVATTDDEKSAARKHDTPWTYDFSKLPNGTLPRKDWNFEIGTEVAGYNKELQAYTPRAKNVRVENGVLVIEAHKENFQDRQYTSARINTLDKWDFTYGTIEVDMMLPEGRGTWPAAWLMPSKNIYKPEALGLSNSDPDIWALNGEIDFAEAIGSLPGRNIPAAHTYNEIKRPPTYTPGFISHAYSQYHKYGVIKTSDKLTFTIDGQPYATREKTTDDPLEWPYNQSYYLILNLAIGGKWAGRDGIDDASASWQLKIRSISYLPL